MKKFILFVFIFLFVLNLARCAHCDDAVKKFSRGLCNVITCYFEILEQSIRVKNAHGSVAGMTYGLLKGAAMTGVRALVGVYEIITFPFPLPADYKPILKDPETFFEESER